MSKDRDKREKMAPPRESNTARQARFMGQTGLNLQGSAKQRRLKAGYVKKSNRKGGR